MGFYESLRVALAKAKSGVHWSGPPLPSHAKPPHGNQFSYPAMYLDFIASFNGVSLFHESLQVFSLQDPRVAPRPHNQVRIGELSGEALWMNMAGTIRLVDEEAPDPILLGSSLENLFNATLAREALLIDIHGTFREVFDEQGELLDPIRQKRFQVGQKKDPGSAYYLLEEAEWHLDHQQTDTAMALLQQALQRDPQAGPALELHAFLLRQQGDLAAAAQQFVLAAQASLHPALQAARWIQAALALPQEDTMRASYVQHAWQAHPSYFLELLQQIQQLENDSREESQQRLDQARCLLAFAPSQLPHLSEYRTRFTEIQKRFQWRGHLPVLS